MLKKNKFLPTILITYVLDRVKYLKRLSDYYQDYQGEVCFIGPKFDINFKASDNFSFFSLMKSICLKKFFLQRIILILS